MEMRSALIVGVGSGLSASLARLFAKNGLQVALASRNPDRLAALARRDRGGDVRLRGRRTRGGRRPVRRGDRHAGRAGHRGLQRPARARGPVAELDPEAVARAIAVSAYAGLPGRPAGGAPHAAARLRRDPVHRRVRQREGLSAVGAVRDGQVRTARPGAEHGARAGAAGHPRGAFRHRWRRSAIPGRTEPPDKPDSMLDPDAIAASYWHVVQQPRSAWTWEMELRPWVERF